MNRAERRQQAKEDAKRLVHGIDPRAQDAEPVAAMARQLLTLFEEAKDAGNIDPAVRFLHAKAEATIDSTKGITLACKKGCAHCCHTWVSVPAPEILFLAKRLKQRQDGAAAERIQQADGRTKGLDPAARKKHPNPCPMLDRDICSVYELRPIACRFASSANAAICARTLIEGGSEPIPSPVVHIRGRSGYQIAMAIALKYAGLPHHFYEFNAAMARAIEVKDADRSWLKGNDIFSGIQRDPTDVIAHPQAQMIYRRAFGSF
jgi:hypothetical protein